MKVRIKSRSRASDAVQVIELDWPVYDRSVVSRSFVGDHKTCRFVVDISVHSDLT